MFTVNDLMHALRRDVKVAGELGLRIPCRMAGTDDVIAVCGGLCGM